MSNKIFLDDQSLDNPASERFDYLVSLQPSSSGLTIHHNLEQLWSGPRRPDQASQSLLILALGVWSADKLISRGIAPDAWTRDLSLSIPLNNGWVEQIKPVESILEFLTGDHWQLEGRASVVDLEFQNKLTSAWMPDSVCLFSGGLDSLAGTIDLLESGRRLLLISHYDYGQLAGCQKFLTEALSKHYGPDRLRRLSMRVQFPEVPELSLRSRALLFIALGIMAANTFSDRMPLVIPENGWISLNPPLTPSRLGSYSTRTTHPFFVSNLQRILERVGLRHPLLNPYQYLTKGELIAQNCNPDLLHTLAPFTLSCAHPVVSRWAKQRQGNCGYCFPCLLRRAALHRVGWDNRADYLYDVLTDSSLLANRARGADLRSLLYAVKTWEADPNPGKMLLLTGPIPPAHYNISSLLRVIAEGFQDIRQWLEKKGDVHLRKFAGW
jgi:7-cyano-7-deazaguanine synthase in queuosine biosynthesis